MSLDTNKIGCTVMSLDINKIGCTVMSLAINTIDREGYGPAHTGGMV